MKRVCLLHCRREYPARRRGAKKGREHGAGTLLVGVEFAVWKEKGGLAIYRIRVNDFFIANETILSQAF
jgi:hypothetical protein